MSSLADLSGMDLFVVIVEEGSLSAAGRVMRLPKATISRRLALLERSLGVPLLIRSTRALSLTDAGRRFFERVSPLVAEARAARLEAQQGSEPSGLLRISVSAVYGQAAIGPRLLRFLDDHPAVRIDLHLGDERVNLVADGYDLVVRMGALDDSDLLARTLTDVPVVIVASPTYLARHGEPTTPAELAHHAAIVTRPNMDRWKLGGETIRMHWRISTGSMAFTRQAALAGLGVAMVPHFTVAEDLKAGALRRILPKHKLPLSPATALTARTGTRSAALSALMNVLAGPEPSVDEH